MKPRSTLRTGTATLLTILLTGLLTACGSGGSSDSTAVTPPPPAANLSASQYLHRYMTDWYLWYTRMPSVDPTTYASDQALLDAVRVPEDWYSYIESAAVYHDFYDEAQAIGYGFGYSVNGNDMWIRYVQPQSNAASSGLRRGDRVTAINGQTIAALTAGSGIDTALGPAQEGLTATMTVTRGAATLTLSMTKSRYAVRSVIEQRVIDAPSGKVGYLNFMSFTAPAQREWQTALQSLLAQGVSDVVVDLRENGGGRLSVASALASSLAPADSQGQIAIRLQFNDRHSGSNQTFTLGRDDSAGKVTRLVWITSPRTCSASESLIAGLRPLRSAWTVGETTCGKPVGFTPPEYNGKVYNIVSFRLANGAGYSDYYDGLAPDCTVAEDWSKPFGDPTEPKLAAALRWLSDGSCPTAAADAIDTRLRARADPVLRSGNGIERLTGLR